ncbi:MAG TPA: NAD(P)/FAD-dependent oxidoreductase [Actinomycetota bacterium]|nr:NAD(P)/FAD-dependent oxidoreductase [Candidatus Nanopelagicales bacterium]HPE11766.1 NAD(P)/FAD-dependent oxidoreductase [Actinomycetota bacterium]HPQ83506.1 NAD(P)/FAD-dependent oxidoreductase [Actinomycetota bacterium]HRV66601.1 NAD(P)/FAD-dependent oxidoreductase [Candidatus Nanopelagicales bacterium]
MKHSADMLIIGAGPVGLYAAYYAGFRGFSTIVCDTLPEIGGQISAMYPEKLIFDVAGFPAVRGRDLVEGLAAQAETYRLSYVLGEQAMTLEHTDDGVRVTTSAGTVIEAKVLLITGGIGAFKPRPLPAADAFTGEGIVFFVPKLDVHAGHDVVIVGGGDSAFDWALSLHPIAKSITLVHRREAFRAHAGTVERVRELGIRLITSSEVTAIEGDKTVTGVEVTHKQTGERTHVPADTVVAALGFIASIGPLADWGLDLDKRRLVVDTTMATNNPRVYAAGDIATYAGKVPLISVGFGEAALAVNNAAPHIDPTHGVFPGHSSGESSA